MGDFESLVARAKEEDWASGSGDLDSIQRHAVSLGWTEVAIRRGDATVSVLRAVEANTAHPKSLSAAYGLGQQPLHTDGAHLPDPPDFVVLISKNPSATPTRLWSASSFLRKRPTLGLIDALRHGMFLVLNGSESFYAPTLSAAWFRYDPGCMTACDARARDVEEFFASQLPEAATHEWSRADQVLLLNNRRTLHARSAVSKDDLDRELIRVAFHAGAAQ